MKYVWLLIISVLLTGCWDTITTMKPGETIELDPMTYGDEYVIDLCRVTRLTPDGAVIIDANSLTIFSDADENISEARITYLTKTGEVTGLVTRVKNWDHSADDIELTIRDKIVDCELANQYTEDQLNSLLGELVEVTGMIYYISGSRVRMQDCE